MQGAAKGHWWALGFAAVVIAWAFGWVLWGRDGESEPYFAFSSIAAAAAGLPLAVAAGFLMARARLRSLGGVVLALATVVMGAAAWFAFFGGVCMDERDVCVTDWPSRVGTLLTAAMAFVAGYLTQRASASRND